MDRIEQIRKRLGDTATQDEYDFLHYISKADVRYLLERLEKAERGWISVADRLPETKGKYLVFRKTNHSGLPITVIHFNPDKVPCWHSACNGTPYFEEVTHWQPLPAPPSDGGKQ